MNIMSDIGDAADDNYFIEELWSMFFEESQAKLLIILHPSKKKTVEKKNRLKCEPCILVATVCFYAKCGIHYNYSSMY